VLEIVRREADRTSAAHFYLPAWRWVVWDCACQHQLFGSTKRPNRRCNSHHIDQGNRSRRGCGKDQRRKQNLKVQPVQPLPRIFRQPLTDQSAKTDHQKRRDQPEKYRDKNHAGPPSTIPCIITSDSAKATPTSFVLKYPRGVQGGRYPLAYPKASTPDGCPD